MSRSTRFEEQKPKLNLKKVFGTIFTIIVLIALAFGIVYAINQGQVYRVRRSILNHYFVSYDPNVRKYGVINTTGEIVIENKYDELILIPDKEKDLFLVTENVDYENGTYEVNAINKNGNIVIKDYQDLKPIEYTGKNVEYDTNLLQFKKDGKYGFLRFDGTQSFKNIFDEVKVMKNIPNRLLVKENGKYGIINTETSDYIVPTLYKSVEPIVADKDTAYIVKFDKKSGIFGSNGKEILPSEYDNIEKINSLDFFKAIKNKETNIYNKEGKVVIKGDIKDIVFIKENIIINKKKGKVGVMDFKKKEILPYKYQEIIPASVDKFIVKLGGKYNVRTKDGDKLLGEGFNSIVFNQDVGIYIASNDSIANIYDIDLNFKQSGIISNIDINKGIIEIYQDNVLKLYNLQFEEKTEQEVYPENNLYLFKNEEGKYGYKNHQDKVIVEPIYDDAKFQNKYGYIAVSKDNKWGVLNYNGVVILEPTLDLSDYLIIDFIKDWYYDKDLSLNIYTRSIKVEEEIEKAEEVETNNINETEDVEGQIVEEIE